jgi:hypothetical protein
MPFVPEEALSMFEAGASTQDIVAAQVITQIGTPASLRTAQRWKVYYEDKTAYPLGENGGGADLDSLDIDLNNLTLESLRKIMEAVEASNQVKDALDPIITTKTFNFKARTTPLVILWAGCFHMFGRFTNHQFILDQVKTALDRGFYMGWLGDEVEGYFSSFRDARPVGDQAFPVNLQFAIFDLFLELLHEHVLCGFSSQHGSLWQSKATGVTTIKSAYMRRKVPYFDGQGYLRFEVGDQTYHVAGAHGFPGFSMHNPNHPQWRAFWQKFPLADAVIQADKHQFAFQKRHVHGFEVEMGNRPSKILWLVQVGTAKEGPEPYTISTWERGFAEWPFMVLYPDTHRVEVTDRLDLVDAMLAPYKNGKKGKSA